MSVVEQRRELVGALADFYLGHRDVERLPMLGTVGRLLAEALEHDGVVATETGALPVTRLLDGVVAETGQPAVDRVLRAFTAAGPILRWVQTTEYVATLSQQFLDNYGYVRVIGPGGLVESDVASAGLGVWGAGLYYPRHEHPAEETYHLLNGSASFQRGAGPWVDRAVGESVHHDPWEHHAQRFGDTTCVLSWAWTGDVAVNARLVPEDG
jgi:hypothetical protein